jgi:2,4-dienoyl-CoA reductase-like NADH-dependent reductase (Old Yellow Enzyme family)
MGEAGVGRPSQHTGDAYRYAFGGDETGLGIDLAEPIAFLRLLVELGVPLVCVSVGSPYYNPHIQRPAYFPPTDGYLPPEDPLVGVARQIEITAELKRACPELAFVGSGYTYLQQWLPNVGQAAVNAGLVDFVGLGRMVLSYHDLPADVLAGRELQNKRICRTFSDCTSGPRNGMLSGCFPLDDYYKQMPENARLTEIKSKFRKSM